MSQPNELMSVEVAYASAEAQVIVPLRVQPPVTVEEAIQRSGILERFAEIDLTRQRVGIFSRPVELTRHLCHKDRVEIYRPLLADPKEQRRRRAAR